jgi:hypothetical protein
MKIHPQTRETLIVWMNLPEDCSDNNLLEAFIKHTGQKNPNAISLSNKAVQIERDWGFCATGCECDSCAPSGMKRLTNPARAAEQPTLRDRLAMSASEADVSAVLRENLDCVPGFGIIRNRQQARYEHADRMLKARAEKH